MNLVQNALLFWQIVEETLVRVYGFERENAQNRVKKVQGRLTERAIARDIAYHSQPFHVAGDIANNLEPLSERALEECDRIRRRLTKKAGVDALTEPSVVERRPAKDASAEPLAVTLG